MAVAATKGLADGELFPFDEALKNLQEIVNAVQIPITFDFESGFAVQPDQVKENCKEVFELGVVGINFEDQVIGNNSVYSIEEQKARIKAIQEAKQESGRGVFINARTDIFLQTPPDNHTNEHAQDAIERSREYAEAGADGFFVPGLTNKELIKLICESSPLPVNIMIDTNTKIEDVLGLGVSRISFGPYQYFKTMAALAEDIMAGCRLKALI